MNFCYRCVVFFIYIIISIVIITGKENANGVVIGNNVRIRSQASLKSSIIIEFFKGNELEIIENIKGDYYKGRNTWYKVKSSYFWSEGYIHSSLIMIIILFSF